MGKINLTEFEEQIKNEDLKFIKRISNISISKLASEIGLSSQNLYREKGNYIKIHELRLKLEKIINEK